MKAIERIQSIQQHIGRLKESLHSNYAKPKLNAHLLYERICSLENEMGDLEVQLKSLEPHQFSPIQKTIE